MLETEKLNKTEVIGTASMKKWKTDGLWTPTTKDRHDANPVGDEDPANNGFVDRVLRQHACLGDYEISVVALPPDSQYRGKGIPEHLVKAC